MQMKISFSAQSVVDLYRLSNSNGIEIWIDGGWGVDALLGEQTRPHDDLDIAIQEKDLPGLHALLGPRGYRNVPRDDTSAWNFVLGDEKGHLVDVHVIVFDQDGNGIYGPPENGLMYPAASLTGKGKILGRAVNCISAEYAVKFHTTYTPDDNDIKDVSALCDRFGIDYPEEYARLQKGNKP
jgi:lincosamide nucleotidyltransferase A/C/D/E